MSFDDWVSAHQYLKKLGDLDRVATVAARQSVRPTDRMPKWADYNAEYRAGVSVLYSSSLEINCHEVETAVTRVATAIASDGLPATVASSARQLIAELEEHGRNAPHAFGWLLEGDSLNPSNPGLLRFIGWRVLAFYLRSIVAEFAKWRDEESWMRAYCPTCGARPAMAHLVAHESSHVRLLCCGQCSTRWQYPRGVCPFCCQQEERNLNVVSVEGETYLRLDCCTECGGYIKTYVGGGDEEVMLADWTSLHMDLVARNHQLTRRCDSLFTF